jgi:hypothetical protein
MLRSVADVADPIAVDVAEIDVEGQAERRERRSIPSRNAS